MYIYKYVYIYVGHCNTPRMARGPRPQTTFSSAQHTPRSQPTPCQHRTTSATLRSLSCHSCCYYCCKGEGGEGVEGGERRGRSASSGAVDNARGEGGGGVKHRWRVWKYVTDQWSYECAERGFCDTGRDDGRVSGGAEGLAAARAT